MLQLVELMLVSQNNIECSDLAVRHSFLLGLPASKIALSRNRLYWNMDSPGIFSVDRTTIGIGMVNVLSDTAQAAFIISLSPDQQLIAG